MFRKTMIIAVSICAVVVATQADTVYLNAGDTSNVVGVPSYNNAGNWSDGNPPSAGNDYVVDGYLLRTENNVAGSEFGGDSLSLINAARLMLSGYDNVPYTINNLVANEGALVSGRAGRSYEIAGNISILAGGLEGNVGTGDDNRTLVILADMTGVGGFSVTGGASGYTKKVTLAGQAAYTGSTAISENTMLEVTGSLLIDVNDGENSDISGLGDLVFDGALRLDVSDVTTSETSWNLIDTTNLGVTYGENFSVALSDGQEFTQVQTGVWSLDDGSTSWEFNTGTGVLTAIPEPSAMVLLFTGSLVASLRRRQK